MAMSQVYPQIGARSNGLGNASIGLDDVWSVYNNPGAFGALKETQLGVSYENRFLLKELSIQSLAFGFHTDNSGNIGLHFQQYGFDLYRETNGGLTYGMKLAENFSAGVSINFHGIYLAENYGSRNTFSAAAGLLYALNKNLKIGMRVQNLSRARLAEFADERLPTAFGLGLQYTISPKVFWSLEAEKDLVHPLNLKSGLEIQAHDVLALRLGINSYPFQSSFGLGLTMKRFQLDLATQWHATLGLSPSGGLKYTFN